MKQKKSLILTLLIALFVFSGNINSFASDKADTDKTTVYYFHNTRRCPTCIAIEKETQKVLKESFSEAVENGDIVFEAYNAEKSENKKVVKELGVTSSALIIVKGADKIDLTSKGFMYGLKQPEKLRQAIKKALTD